MKDRIKPLYKWIALLSITAVFLVYRYPVISKGAQNKPDLRYFSRVLYIGGDSLNQYPDSCWTPSKNVEGWSVKYQIIEGTDLITIEKNGRITVTGEGIGAAKVKVTYLKMGELERTSIFTVKVRRNASHVRLTNLSESLLDNPIMVDESILFEAAKSYDGSYKKGHYGLDNYRKVVNDSIRLESLTPEIISVDGLSITAEKAGVGKFVVKAYQYGEDKFTGVQSKTYTIHVEEKVIPVEPTDAPEPTVTPEMTVTPELTITPEATITPELTIIPEPEEALFPKVSFFLMSNFRSLYEK